MLMLLAHMAGDKFTVVGGELHLTAGDGTVPAPAGALDELEERKWIEVRADGETVATGNGKYWAERWLKVKVGPVVLKGGTFKVTGERV